MSISKINNGLGYCGQGFVKEQKRGRFCVVFDCALTNNLAAQVQINKIIEVVNYSGHF